MASPNATCRTFFLGPDLRQLDVLRRELEQFGEAHGLNPAMVFELNLALDELITNILTHGFKAGLGTGIQVRLGCLPAGVEVELSDDGTPFDPNVAPQPDTTCDLSQRCIGGLGIHLAKKLVDALEYERRQGRNVITLRKSGVPRCGGQLKPDS